MSSHQIAKNQHYVWRFYLEAWAESGNFSCYFQDRQVVTRTQPKSIAAQRYFYEIPRLSEDDLIFLRLFNSFIKDRRLRKLNDEFISNTQRAFKIQDHTRKRVLKNKTPSPDKRGDQQFQRELLENFHSRIEHDNMENLKSLREGDSSFYAITDRRIKFIHFLCIQYFRTANMQRRMGNMPSIVCGHDPKRTANIFNIILAHNTAASLIADHSYYKISILENHTTTPFITSDQPVINLFDCHKSNDICFYYPIKPDIALIFSTETKNTNPTIYEIETLNCILYNKSHNQLFSNNTEYLKELVRRDKNMFSNLTF